MCPAWQVWAQQASSLPVLVSLHQPGQLPQPWPARCPSGTGGPLLGERLLSRAHSWSGLCVRGSRCYGAGFRDASQAAGGREEGPAVPGGSHVGKHPQVLVPAVALWVSHGYVSPPVPWVLVFRDSKSPFVWVSRGPWVWVSRDSVSPFLRVSRGPWLWVSQDSVSLFLRVSRGPWGRISLTPCPPSCGSPMAPWGWVSRDSMSPFLRVSCGPWGRFSLTPCPPSCGSPAAHGCGSPKTPCPPSCGSPMAPWGQVSRDSMSPFLRVSHGPWGWVSRLLVPLLADLPWPVGAGFP